MIAETCLIYTILWDNYLSMFTFKPLRRMIFFLTPYRARHAAFYVSCFVSDTTFHNFLYKRSKTSAYFHHIAVEYTKQFFTLEEVITQVGCPLTAENHEKTAKMTHRVQKLTNKLRKMTSKLQKK